MTHQDGTCSFSTETALIARDSPIGPQMTSNIREMTVRTAYVFVSSMDIEPEREELFNNVYDSEHIPSLLEVPGVLSIARFQREDLTMSIGGEVRIMPRASAKYHAVYALESPDVLVSDSWARAVELGRWPQEVRPFTTNRQLLLARRLSF
jgi:hypothetical protein